MAKHTQLEYGKLLKQQLEKRGMCVGLQMEEGERGWAGSLILARGSVRCEDSFTDLQAEACLYVDDEGAIRVYYSEPIVIDSEKKTRYDAQQEEKRRIEEEMQHHPERYFSFAEDEEEYAEVQLEEEECAAYDAEPTEDLEYISEKQELELLRALNEMPCQVMLYNRKNENRLIYNGRYQMDACSRNSAKKAAVYICDELFVICGYIEYLSAQLGFVRVKPQEKWRGWEDVMVNADILDDFLQIDGYLAEKRRTREKQELVRKIEEKERFLEWVIEKLHEQQGDEGYAKAEEILEQVGQEIAQKKAELASFEENGAR